MRRRRWVRLVVVFVLVIAFELPLPDGRGTDLIGHGQALLAQIGFVSPPVAENSRSVEQ
ncbi:MAG: hypothetical protein ACYTBZ_05815 [Planctomycetota bacterium]